MWIPRGGWCERLLVTAKGRPLSRYTHPGVDREALATILRREIARRPNNRPHPCSNETVYRGLQDEIAASGLMTKQTAVRRLYAILNPSYQHPRSGQRAEQQMVALDTADKILTALDLNYLWHTELKDAVVFPKCSSCGGEMNELNPDCQRCQERFAVRRFRDKSAPANRPGLGSRPAAPQRGGTSGGTTLEEAA